MQQFPETAIAIWIDDAPRSHSPQLPPSQSCLSVRRPRSVVCKRVGSKASAKAFQFLTDTKRLHSAT